jgi:V-type H+-transporting ATPase subunit a
MKISVILGVAQMTLGIFLKGLNGQHFGKPFDVYHEVLPQLLLLLALFGFMDLLIIQKWLTDWTGMNEEARAPGIVNVMINLALNLGKIDPEKEIPIIEGQESICKLIMFIALITPPWMLFVKPGLLYLQNKAKSEKDYVKIEMTSIDKDKSAFNDIEENNDLLGKDDTRESESLKESKYSDE